MQLVTPKVVRMAVRMAMISCKIYFHVSFFIAYTLYDPLSAPPWRGRTSLRSKAGALALPALTGGAWGWVIKKVGTMKKETWKYIIQLIVAILTAILTTFGVTSCMGHGPLF